jgi:CBS domain-containing protein
MKAADVMTRRIVSVPPEASIAEAVRTMLEHGISGLPVVDADGEVAGIITEGDLLRRSETGTERKRPRWIEMLVGPGRLASEYVHTHGRKVSEIMTTDVASVAENAALADVVELMERKRIKRVPVLRDGRIVGIVSRANLLRALAGVAPEIAPGSASDQAIRAQLLAEVDQRSWGPRNTIDVVVRNGVVDLWGVILDERARLALRVAAENVPGVAQVRDHLVWVEPHSGIVIDAPPSDEGGTASRKAG